MRENDFTDPVLADENHIPDITLTNNYAGVWDRLLALSIDSLVWLIFFLPVVFHYNPLMQVTASDNINVYANSIRAAVGELEQISNYYNIFFVIFWWVIPEASTKMQASPGKYIMKMKVIDKQGNNIGILRSLTRNMIKMISCLFILPLLIVYLNSQRRALHDIIAGTYVVYR